MNGNGLITSQSSAAGNTMLTTLAINSAAEMNVTSFAGQSVAASAIFVKFTYIGDATLNGVIDGDDYFQIDANVDSSGSVFGNWRGDFDANGLIDADDYFLIDRNYSRQFTFTASSPVLRETMAPSMTMDASAGVSAVPEPSAIIAAIGSGALWLRRSRSTSTR